MRCRACKKEKRKSLLFSKGKLLKACEPCRKAGAAKFRKHYAENSEAVQTRINNQRREDPEKYRVSRAKSSAAWAKANPESVRAKSKRWRKRNPAKVTAKKARRRAAQMRATPRWADKKAIGQVYGLARLQAVMEGKIYHVDHIVPLKGVNAAGEHIASGLHVPANLAIVQGPYNSRKKNRIWPDMP